MLVTVSGIVTETRFVQLLNEYASISVTPFSIITLFISPSEILVVFQIDVPVQFDLIVSVPVTSSNVKSLSS